MHVVLYRVVGCSILVKLGDFRIKVIIIFCSSTLLFNKVKQYNRVIHINTIFKGAVSFLSVDIDTLLFPVLFPQSLNAYFT